MRPTAKSDERSESKKKIAIKIFARLCHDDDDGVSWWRQIWRWVDMPTPHPVPLRTIPGTVNLRKLHSKIERRSVRVIGSQHSTAICCTIVASVEWAFHLAVRGLKDVFKMGILVLLYNQFIVLLYQLWAAYCAVAQKTLQPFKIVSMWNYR